jgi:hypothetical protein
MFQVAQAPSDDEERRKEKEALGIQDQPSGLWHRLRRLFRKDESEKPEEDKDTTP